MNERIKELALQAGVRYVPSSNNGPLRSEHLNPELEKFAELIVRECIDKMLNSDDAEFMVLEGWELGGANHNAWTRGVLDSVSVVREHFGVEE